jgi:formylglycine-generating enzyme required for sulfatase activity
MERPLDALPEGTKLAGYVIGRVLGRGGFGVTYLATDSLYPDVTAAIKEFLPEGLAMRRSGDLSVQPSSPGRADAYRRALASFETEARTLVALRHPNVVEVQRYIEANGTAYVVMKYEEGKSLADLVKGGKTLSEAEIIEVLPPLLDGLEAVHAKNYVHRDIKPGNIYLRVADGSPVLLDFGAARQAIGEERKTSISEIYTPGYAPFEQYDRHAEQGPYTDIYALGATLYRCITGETPPEAPTRINAVRKGADALVPVERAAKGRYVPALFEAVRRSLTLDERARPQSIGELRAILGIEKGARSDLREPASTLVRSTLPVQKRIEPSSAPRPPAPLPSRTLPTPKRSRAGSVFAALVLVGALAIAGYYFAQPPEPQSTSSAKPSETAPRTAGQVFRECPECPEMVVIPAGAFMMGSPTGEAGRRENEGPQRRVTISKTFALGKFEVTFAEWDACVSAGGCKHRPDDKGWGRDRRPVIHASWEDAKSYAAWLSRKTGRSYRLPTEAEWEYAARAGTTTPYSTGSTISLNQANHGVVHGRTLPVGSYPANAFGLHDMAGNVSEWVEDCEAPDYSHSASDERPWLTGTCATYRVLRGGDWGHLPEALRSAWRNALHPRLRDHNIGFRIARTFD